MAVSRSLSLIVIAGVRVYNIGKDVTCYVFQYTPIHFERSIKVITEYDTLNFDITKIMHFETLCTTTDFDLLNIEQIGKFNDLIFDPLNRITNIITQCFQRFLGKYPCGVFDSVPVFVCGVQECI